MQIEFDPAKNTTNREKHGVSLVWVDERLEYNEMRMIALVPQTEILYYVAFVERGEARRIISLRRANRREVRHYVENS